VFFVSAFVEQQSQARPGVNVKVMPAFAADIVGGFEILFPDNLAATVALQPEAFRANGVPVATGLLWISVAFKPGHDSSYLGCGTMRR
jgi:hypothetical protein